MYLYKYNKYILFIDLYHNKSDNLILNIIETNITNNNRLLILKYFEIYKFIKLHLNKIEKDSNNKIYKLEKCFDYTSYLPNDIID